jgi:hypothetical protein
LVLFLAAAMDGSRAGGGSGGDYISSLLNSSPMLDFGVLGGAPALDGAGDCLERFCGDPGFAERAARLSSFNGQRFAAGLIGMPPPAPGTEFGGGSREASSVSDPASAMKDANAKKRKAPAAKGKAKDPSVSTSGQVSFVSFMNWARSLSRSVLLRVIGTDRATSILTFRQGSRVNRMPSGARRAKPRRR